MRAKSTFVGLVAFGISAVAMSAGAHALGGGSSISSAPVIPLNQNIQGSWAARGGYGSGYDADYYKVTLKAGDHVLIRAQSVGEEAPCILAYRPGTDDFNFVEDRYIRGSWNDNTNHNQFSFIAGQAGTFVLLMHDACDSGYHSGQWGYVFTVNAPHALRLSLPPGVLVAGTNRLRISVKDALNEPVTDGALTVTLTMLSRGQPPKQFAPVRVTAGVASFTFNLARTARGRTERIVVRAGDNVTWVSTGTARTYRIR
jgi:hypothetical protein